MVHKDVVVRFTDGVVTVDQPKLIIEPGVTAEIHWIPEPGSDWVLRKIIFTRPIGAGTPISQPQPGPGGTIVVTDVNNNTSGQKDIFKYLVYVEKDGKLVPSEDPQIENDPEGDVDEDEDEDEDEGED